VSTNSAAHYLPTIFLFPFKIGSVIYCRRAFISDAIQESEVTDARVLETWKKNKRNWNTLSTSNESMFLRNLLKRPKSCIRLGH
jgi:hypothetical protein